MKSLVEIKQQVFEKRLYLRNWIVSLVIGLVVTCGSINYFPRVAIIDLALEISIIAMLLRVMFEYSALGRKFNDDLDGDRKAHELYKKALIKITNNKRELGDMVLFLGSIKTLTTETKHAYQSTFKRRLVRMWKFVIKTSELIYGEDSSQIKKLEVSREKFLKGRKCICSLYKHAGILKEFYGMVEDHMQTLQYEKLEVAS